MKRNAALLAALLTAVSGPARAVNYQDLWWAGQQESGWGLQLVQQGEQLFGTWFVYGQNSQPLWFTWISDPVGTNPNVRTGRLYAVTGSFFGTIPFVGGPAQDKGSATFTFADARTATLQYTFDNTSTTKQITRQTFRAFNIAGTYQGGIFRSATGCSNSNNNGTRLGDPTTFSVTHAADTNALVINELGGLLCRFSGTFVQFGSTYEATGGTYTCQGETGTWTGREGTHSETTFGLKLALRPAGDVCTVNATIGGFKQPAG